MTWHNWTPEVIGGGAGGGGGAHALLATGTITNGGDNRFQNTGLTEWVGKNTVMVVVGGTNQGTPGFSRSGAMFLLESADLLATAVQDMNSSPSGSEGAEVSTFHWAINSSQARIFIARQVGTNELLMYVQCTNATFEVRMYSFID